MGGIGDVRHDLADALDQVAARTLGRIVAHVGMLAPGDARAGIACPAQTSAQVFAPFGQRYAWASAYAAAVLFEPAGPQNRYAWLTCPPRTLARKKSRTRGWPNMFSNASATIALFSPAAALALRLWFALGRARPFGVLQAGKASHLPRGQKAPGKDIPASSAATAAAVALRDELERTMRIRFGSRLASFRESPVYT